MIKVINKGNLSTVFTREMEVLTPRYICLLGLKKHSYYVIRLHSARASRA
jgi:hypothetical protein